MHVSGRLLSSLDSRQISTRRHVAGGGLPTNVLPGQGEGPIIRPGKPRGGGGSEGGIIDCQSDRAAAFILYSGGYLFRMAQYALAYSGAWRAWSRDSYRSYVLLSRA